jgi:isopentenyl-diphosphate delta-isomerase type 1
MDMPHDSVRSSSVTMDEELVVLLDAEGRPSGTAPKRFVHHAATPLHLAFSCWVFDARGRTLLTRRSAAKQTWPDAWTNTCCGHPAPGEPIDEAVTRRARQELGLVLQDTRVALPDFRYRAVMTNGIVENEVCPVYVARTDGELSLDATEVGDARWATLDEVGALVRDRPAACSPWMILQLPQLLELPAIGPG